jgi:hypothetical protein
MKNIAKSKKEKRKEDVKEKELKEEVKEKRECEGKLKLESAHNIRTKNPFFI